MEQAITVLDRAGNATERRWEVDLWAAGAAQAWAERLPRLLADEVADMASYFPRWLLVLASNNAIERCGRCGELIVFAEGAARCVGCWTPFRTTKATQLAWMGHLPAPVGGLPKALKRIRREAHPAYPLIELNGSPLWLAPIMAYYPNNWPRQAPQVRYDSRLFSILGITSPSAVHHIVGGNIMCLYGGEPWREITMRVVLQQRVVNHLASMLKIGDGQRPVEAFAGRQHVYDRDYYER